MQKLFFIILSILFSTMLFSQKATIVGRVGDGRGFLPGVNIFIKNTGTGTSTDLDGRFQLSNLPVEPITIVVSYLGFENVEKDIDLKAGMNNLGNITINEASQALEEVIVRGTMAPSQIKALSIKRNSLAYMDVLAADAIGKLPDRNAAEAVQRLPSASVNRYHGEANQVSVRGTPYAWSSMLYNGTRLPSANVFGSRNALLDAIPAEMIQYVQMAKVITPDMEGDAIGGSVNFITRSAPESRSLNMSLAGGYNAKAQRSTYNGSILYGDRFLNGKLGFNVAAAIWNRNFAADEIVVDYNINRPVESERNSINSVNAKRYLGFRNTMAINAAIEYEIDKSNKVYARIIRDRFDDVRPVYESFYEFERRRYRYSYRFSEYITNLNGIDVGTIHKIGSRIKIDWSYSHFDMNYRLETPPGMPNDQKGLPIAQFFQRLQGDFGVRSSDNLVYNTFDSPNGVGINPLNLQPNLTQPEVDAFNPSKLRLEQLIIFQIDQRDKDHVGQLNISHDASKRLKLKAGGKLRNKEYIGNLTPLVFLPSALLGIPGATPPKFLSDMNTESYPATSTFFSEINNPFSNIIADPITKQQLFDIFTPEFFEANTIRDVSPATNPTTKFNGTENVFAGYIMGVYSPTDKLDIIGGVRNEFTHITMNSSRYNGATKEVSPITQKTDYNAFLPMLQLKYAPYDNVNIRAAYTKTFIRANFPDLNPGENVDFSGAQPRITRGNALLKPTFSHNIDLLGEWFLKDIGVLTGGVFYKKIEDYIFRNTTFETINGTQFLITQPTNLENASLLGFEMGITKRFSTLPGFLSGFGTDFNISVINTDLNVPRIGADGQVITVDKATLPNQSGLLYNISLFYEKYGITARLAGNYRGKSVETINQNIGPDFYVYTAPNFTMDFSSSYSISDKIKLFVEVRNLNNEPFRQYLGNNPDRTTTYEWFGINGQLGFRWILF